MLRPASLLGLLLLACVAGLMSALLIGSVSLPSTDVFAALIGNPSEPQHSIVWQLRLPRALSAFTVGGLLALSGALLQVLLRNPLADPYVLGTSGGAAVGALLAMLAGLSGAWLNGSAFVGAVFANVPGVRTRTSRRRLVGGAPVAHRHHHPQRLGRVDRIHPHYRPGTQSARHVVLVDG